MTLVVLACFFLSGASGLVFEEVWTRELTLVFGSTTLALSTVLSVFMGGLALGSRLGGRIADKLQDRLRAYALAEAGIGLYALAVPFVLEWYPSLNAALYRLFGDHAVGLSLGRFFAAALLLLIPTTLMGATLPILSRHFVRPGETRSAIGATVGSLYALNTFGAVVGTFVGGFILLPGPGVLKTNYAAAATNLSLAALVMIARRGLQRAPVEGALTDVPSEPEPDPFRATETQRKLALWAFAISGAVAMVYQVLWTRSLAIVLGSSVYSFTLILLAFLVGLGGGAALVSRWTRRSARPMEWLGAVHALIAASIAFSYVVMDKLPAAFLGLLRGESFSVDGILFTQFMLAALAVLPATFFMGGVLPLTVRIYASGADRVGRDVGTAYSVNTLGAIIGSFAAGFVVLPSLGLQRGMGLGALITIGLAAAFWYAGRPSARRAVWALALVLASIGVTRALPRWSLAHFSAGLFRVSIAKDIIETNRWSIPTLEYYHDGIATTVSVERWGKTVALKNNGKVDASNGDDMATQIMVGLMPFLFHEQALDRPPRAAVIGYGSGVTIGAVTQFPIAHADVVELEPKVVWAGNQFFGAYNHHPENDSRVKIIIGDGRNFLTQKSDLYDVIVSEPSNPWITGVSNLFTVDYWKLAKGRLAPDGVFCQWAQLYEMSSANIKTILKSFSSVFPYTYVFAAEDLSSDVLLIAAHKPISLDLDRLRRNWKNPTLAAELKRAGLHEAEDLIAQILLVPEELPAFTAGSPLNTDDNARIEFSAPRDLLGSTRTADPYLARVYGTEWPYARFDRKLVLAKETRGQDELTIARALLRHGKRGAAERYLAAARRHGVAEGTHIEKLVRAFRIRDTEDREEPLSDAEGADKDSGISGLDPPRVPSGVPDSEATRIATDWLSVEKGVRARAWAHALMALKGWPERYVDEGGLDLELLVGYLEYKADLSDEAVDRLRPLLDEPGYPQKRPALLYYLARAQYGAALFEPAVRNMEKWLDAKSR
jgi:spermidine synthase